MNKFVMDGKSVKWGNGGGQGLTEPDNKGGLKTQSSIHPYGRSNEYRQKQRRNRAAQFGA